MTRLLIKTFIKNFDNISDTNVRQKYGVMSGIVGICCNIVLAGAKFVAGMLSSSIAVTADAFNNLSDAGSSVVSLIGFKMAGRPADDDHPFGHGRAEYVSGFVVSMVILLMGFELLKSSVEKIISPQMIEFSIVSFVILLASIAVKLWMCLFNRRIAKTINSPAIKATAMDSLSDVAATSTVAIGMLISKFAGLNVDAYTGIIVALFILYTGFNTAKDTINPLLGQAPDTEFVKQIEKKVLSYDGVIGLHDLIVHNYGSNNRLVSLHAEVPSDIDILIIHDTIDLIERELKREFNCDAVIHMDPIVTDDIVTGETCKRILALVRLIDKCIDIHDFRMVEGKTHTNLIFDVVVPHKFRLSDCEIIEAIGEAVKALDNTFEVVINVDKAYIAK